MVRVRCDYRDNTFILVCPGEGDSDCLLDRQTCDDVYITQNSLLESLKNAIGLNPETLRDVYFILNKTVKEICVIDGNILKITFKNGEEKTYPFILDKRQSNKNFNRLVRNKLGTTQILFDEAGVPSIHTLTKPEWEEKKGI